MVEKDNNVQDMYAYLKTIEKFKGSKRLLTEEELEVLTNNLIDKDKRND